MILRGAIASNSADVTGDGGIALIGNGGSSGSIGSFGKLGKFYAGGAAGDGGELKINAGGSITTSEAIFATGGDAGALSPLNPSGMPGLYLPVTGDGGNGSSQGGNSGSIGIAGVAGHGGSVSLTTAKPISAPGAVPGSLDIEADRIIVNGGRAGTEPVGFHPGRHRRAAWYHRQRR